MKFETIMFNLKIHIHFRVFPEKQVFLQQKEIRKRFHFHYTLFEILEIYVKTNASLKYSSNNFFVT